MVSVKKTASHYVTLQVETYSILLQQVPTLLGSCKQPSVTLNKMRAAQHNVSKLNRSRCNPESRRNWKCPSVTVW